jgi:hypothetical protein
MLLAQTSFLGYYIGYYGITGVIPCPGEQRQSPQRSNLPRVRHGLHAFADASYLCRSHARSVAGAIFVLGNKIDPTRINGSIHVFSTIIPCVVASAGEAKYAVLFATEQHAASLRTTLADMGYPQEPTIIMCDNTSAIGITTDSIKQKRSKAVDMRFHWIRDRVSQAQLSCLALVLTKV